MPRRGVESEMSAKSQKAKKQKLLDRRGNAGVVPAIFSEVAMTPDRQLRKQLVLRRGEEHVSIFACAADQCDSWRPSGFCSGDHGNHFRGGPRYLGGRHPWSVG